MPDVLPIVIDLETRSACDLRTEGGHRYALDPTTRILTAAWTEDMGETFHCWMPGHEAASESIREKILPGVTLHFGPNVPERLSLLRDRPWVGHNCWTFDGPVWHALVGWSPVEWQDTYPEALTLGLPGQLGKIGEMLWGKGKYADGAATLKKWYKAERKPGDSEPCNVPIGATAQIAVYNVQDVRLTAQLRSRIVSEQKLPVTERRVMKAHNAINSRGVRVDRGLVTALINLSDQSIVHATESIRDLTAGCKVPLKTDKDLRSRNTIFAWLDGEGISVGTSLRKDVIARFIDANTDRAIEEEDNEYEGPDNEMECGTEEAAREARAAKNLPRVVKVLELRMQALRITGGKLKTALNSIDATDRARALFAYWAAHTGRWGGRRIQVQNLPRPKEGVDTWGLIKHYETNGTLDYADVRAMLPIGARGGDGKLLYPFLSVDDASSGLLRSIFIPDEGQTLAAADLANIEARVLAWLAGEKWLMEAFWSGSDPYMLMAVKIFGPTERWPQFPDPKKAGAFLPLKKHPYRQVGKVVVLGCGYGLGVGKFTAYAAQSGIDLEAVGTTAADCIYAYRRMHPAIAGAEAGEYDKKPYFRGGLWDKLNEAATIACTGGRANVGPVAFYGCDGAMVIELPSKRRLVYRDARLEKRQFGNFNREIMSPTYTSPRYGTKALYGGAIAENVVQAMSRDILGHGMVLCEDAGIPIVLHCHDELVSSTYEERFAQFMALMTTCPDWLTNFPLDAEGSCAPRYAKAPPPGVKEVVYRNGAMHK